MSKMNVSAWKRLLLSETLADKSKSQKIAYVAVMTAIVVVANMFFEFKLTSTQFSFTLLISTLTGMIIGPLFGAVACFLGDLVGFLYNSGGYIYMPWIGISMGLAAMISGFVIGGLHSDKKWFLWVKLGIIAVLTFTICTVLINTTAFWVLYTKKKVEYSVFLYERLFVYGQIWNSLANYALLFIITPALEEIKVLKIRLN